MRIICTRRLPSTRAYGARRTIAAMPALVQSSPSVSLGRPDDETVVGVLGLGYVGLPLAVAFGQCFETRGFDVDRRRVQALRRGDDVTREVSAAEIDGAERLAFTDSLDDLRGCDVFVVSVPTPVDAAKQPDLAALEAASRMVGRVMASGNIAVFESTVFPGATEEVCVPLLEAESGLTCDTDFFVGYSPERVNPGDKQHRLADIVKVTAGSTPAAAAFVDALYACIVPAGTHRAASIRIAEAAKVIENIQRDLNIALVNEFAMIFDRLGLDTQAVLAAAASKWNFQHYQPGLVGGHCIGVDPYYFAAKAEEVGHPPELVLAGRRINDAMACYVAQRTVDLMRQRGIGVAGSCILVLGLAFKENCSDVRNTKVVDLTAALHVHGAETHVYDPWVAAADGVALIDEPTPGRYDAVILAVAHDVFRDLGAERVRAFGKPRCVIFDVKSLLPAHAVDGRL